MRRRHEHQHEAVAVSHSRPSPFVVTNVTVVLWRCAGCRDVKTQELAGEWALWQVRGEQEPAVTEHSEVLAERRGL